MLINFTYPTRVTYILDTSSLTDPLSPFGKRTRKDIQHAINKLEELGYVFKFESFTEELLREFIPLYEANIKTKESGIVFDLKQRLLVGPKHDFPFFMLNLYLNEKYIGGMIFSNRRNYISRAYKYFPKQLDNNISIAFSYVAEYYINQYAIENKLEFIKIGKDRNVYGSKEASNIGLALYKIRCGYTPWIPLQGTDDLEFKNAFEWDEKNDVLIYEGSQYDIAVPQLVLCTTTPEFIEDKYGILKSKSEKGIFKLKIITSPI